MCRATRIGGGDDQREGADSGRLDRPAARRVGAIISQAGYSEQDAEIVRRYVIDKTPQIDVAVELDMARSTITRRLPQIYARARHTAAKLKMISD